MVVLSVSKIAVFHYNMTKHRVRGERERKGKKREQHVDHVNIICGEC